MIMAPERPAHITEDDGQEYDQENSNIEELAPLDQYEGWHSALPDNDDIPPRSSVPVGPLPENPRSHEWGPPSFIYSTYPPNNQWPSYGGIQPS
jgi:hypothetical protein